MALRAPDGGRPGHLLIAAVSGHLAARINSPGRTLRPSGKSSDGWGGRWACPGDIAEDYRHRPVPAVELVSGARRELLKTGADIAMASNDAPVPATRAGGRGSTPPARPGVGGGIWPISTEPL